MLVKLVMETTSDAIYESLLDELSLLGVGYTQLGKKGKAYKAVQVEGNGIHALEAIASLCIKLHEQGFS